MDFCLHLILSIFFANPISSLLIVLSFYHVTTTSFNRVYFTDQQKVVNTCRKENDKWLH